MAEMQYYGRYATFHTKDKKEASVLLGADNLVGDVFEIEFVREETDSVAWMKNRFGERVAFFDEQTTTQLQLCRAKNWHCVAILSLVCFTDSPEPGFFWGEAAIIAYPENSCAFEAWIKNVGAKLADSVRIDVTLTPEGAESVEESGGTWMPSGRVEKPEMEKGSAICKSSRSFTEKMVELARARNMGCMIGGWVGLLAVVAVIVLVFRSCSGM